MLDPTKTIKRVPFNAGNFEHRKAVAKFNRTGKWDIYFEVTQGCKNLPYTLTNESLDFYVSQEVRCAKTPDVVGVLIN